jgi:predicted naringenin-chalcone synthase
MAALALDDGAGSDAAGSLTQDQVLGRLGLAGDEFAEGIFARSGVERRRLKLDDDFLQRDLQGRTDEVEQELFESAVRAIDKLGVDRESIGTVLSASLYSLGCPTLAHRLVEHYRMDPTTDKYHVVGVGCASAVPLFRLASQSLHAHPHKDVLVVAAESMSSILMPATPQDSRAKTVGSAIFGDGCAAALVSCRRNGTGPAILASKVHQMGDTLPAVSLAATPGESYMHLARDLPELAAADLGELVAAFLHDNGVEREAIDHWIVHPGGRRIMEGVRDAIALTDEDVAISWQALADHGNIGTPSIFYVLAKTIEQRAPRPGEQGVVVTIGPGVTVGLMLLEW